MSFIEKDIIRLIKGKLGWCMQGNTKLINKDIKEIAKAISKGVAMGIDKVCKNHPKKGNHRLIN